MRKPLNEAMDRWEYMNEEEESLLTAIRNKNKKAIKHFDDAVERGDRIRIM